jgi:hypothetical protein
LLGSVHESGKAESRDKGSRRKAGGGGGSVIVSCGQLAFAQRDDAQCQGSKPAFQTLSTAMMRKERFMPDALQK